MTSPEQMRGPSGSGDTVLAAHVEQCEVCRSAPPALDRIAAALRSSTIPLDTGALSARTVVRLRPALERRASALLWRRIAAGVLLALLPLPAVLAYNAYLLLVVYDLVSAVLPAAFAAYLVLSYAAALVLLFAATYAAIPVVLARESARSGARMIEA